MADCTTVAEIALRALLAEIALRVSPRMPWLVTLVFGSWVPEFETLRPVALSRQRLSSFVFELDRFVTNFVFELDQFVTNRV